MLSALTEVDCDPSVIVSLAYDDQPGGDVRRRASGATVEDLRSSLEALAGDEVALMRALRRPLTIQRLGRRPLGNFVLASLANAFGDHLEASRWLGEQLGIAGDVLPATTEPVRRELELPGDEVSRGGRWGGSASSLARLRFSAEHLETPEATIAAIEEARWALLAPGSLYRCLLSVAAVPSVASALKRSHARVLWFANLEPDPSETADMTAIDHLRVLRRHNIRVDAVLFDPEATLRFEPAALARYGVQPIPRALRSKVNHARHDPSRLRAVIGELISSRPTSTVDG